ncbi:MAG: tRNA nucleotidyltransferase [Rhodospirillaceae bacterium]|jgi:poly(A) polymerase|nr:tRNA nucleotidyltransferase [Rhodospirillaceae bacterium]|tara:strand:+ start:1435 stop:2730 length:1296 start_codon:yes stop_codon:yes gene_type:complete
MVSLNASNGPTGKISPQPWLTAPETRTVVEALTADGAEVRFVGGCVRDAMAQRPVEDVDIGTPDKPKTVIGLLEKAGIKAVPTGIEHGTVTAVVGDKKFEITTLRRDVKTDGRRAKVAFTDDWTIDSERRDFTINALSATPDGDVYDPHDGIGDLACGNIRFVGLAVDRIEEDVLRLLRFFRFYGLFGRPPPDQDAMAACRDQANKLPGLSGERIRDEMFKILLVPEPADITVLMRGLGIFDHILPEAGDVGRLRMIGWLETGAIKIDSVAPDPLRRLAALLDTGAEGSQAVAGRFKLSNPQARRLSALAAAPADIGPDADAAAVNRALRRLGPDTVRDLALLAWAGELSLTPRLPAGRTQAWIGLLETCDGWQGVVFPIRGEDVAALGVAEGPRIGELLARVEDWWEDGDYAAARDECLEKLKSLLEEDG